MKSKIENELDFEIELLKLYVNYRIEEFTKIVLYKEKFLETFRRHETLIYDQKEVFTMSFEEWRPYGEFMLLYNEFWISPKRNEKRKITDINEIIFVMHAAQTNRHKFAKVVNRFNPLTPDQSFLINNQCHK